MTLAELNHKFFKAQILMMAGTVIGSVIAYTQGLSHLLTFGFFIGLLFSIHIYRQCIVVLIAEYKRLKREKNRHEKK